MHHGARRISSSDSEPSACFGERQRHELPVIPRAHHIDAQGTAAKERGERSLGIEGSACGLHHRRAHAQLEVEGREHRDEERERIAVGKGCVERAELALAGRVRVVAVQHVHEIVMHHALRHAVRLAGKGDAAGAEVIGDGASERPFRTRGKGVESRGERGVAVEPQYEDDCAHDPEDAFFVPRSAKEAPRIG